MNPNQFGDPGGWGTAYLVCATPGGDGGGVHTNSGVPNHAFALMTDGGSFNGYTITGIGLTKAGKIQYRALTRYLALGSDFLDNYNALKQSCTDLVGTSGITSGDCTEVGKALDAVEMDDPWTCSPIQPARSGPLPVRAGAPDPLLRQLRGGPRLLDDPDRPGELPLDARLLPRAVRHQRREHALGLRRRTT